MGLTKYKIGDLVTIVDERNNLDIRDFYGININKEFILTVANTEGLDETKYKVVRKNRFVYSGMQTGRDKCIRVSMYNYEKPILVSPAYTTFEVTATDVAIPLYFFMKFLSKEMDRYGAFCSDDSIRSNLDWDVFCDIDIELPPLQLQQKYVDVYNAMLANQQSYERGLGDLRIVCEGYLDNLRTKLPHKKIGDYIELLENKNEFNEYNLDNVRGVSIEKRFIKTKADMKDVDLRPYYIVKPNEFAYVTVTSRNGEKISMAFNDTTETYICSSSYVIFKCRDENKLLPRYLRIYFERSEFNRYARFHSWGSARETFDYTEMKEVCIPIPDISVQRAIADIFESYTNRRSINEKLKAQIKDICPVLIKGSIEEARKRGDVING
ncbi:MAG: restriction endonuclease subunit S [Lachnospiraceae bacterium]|nr:restriction endonuclease subunit S [Lachnospiraceae bacterium]